MSFWDKFAEGLGYGLSHALERVLLGRRKPTPEEEEQLYQQYATDLAAVEDRKKTNTEQYDKALLSLSSGVLVLSIAFLDKMAVPGHTVALWAVIACWCCMLATILLTLFSFQQGQKALDKGIELIHRDYKCRPDVLTRCR